MAYQTGSAISTSDLVNKLRLFGESIGWLTNRSAGGVWHFRDATSSVYFAMESSNGQQTQHGGQSTIPVGKAIHLVSTTGYDSGAFLKDQPGVGYRSPPSSGSKTTTMELAPSDSGAGNYWFFGTSTYLHAVWARPDGFFRHLQIGTLDKKGMVYSGGQYTQANGIYWNIPNRYTAIWGNDTYNQPALRLGGFDSFNGLMEHPYGLGSGRFSRHPDNALAAGSANAFTGDTVLVPNRVLVEGSNRRRWYVGETPDFAIVSMLYCNPEQILTYGAEEWQVFPCLKKGLIAYGSSDNSWSADIGYAFRVRR